MQVITTKTKVYKYNELPKEVQNKVLENLYDINTDYDWFDMTVSEDFPAKLHEIGLSGSKFYFSLDRDNYIYCDDLGIEDIKKLLKTIKVDLRSKEAKSIIENGLIVDKQHYGMGIAKNYIQLGYSVIDTAKSLDIENKLQALLESTFDEFKSILSKEYDYLTSEEAIIDTIEANDYDFTIDGTIF